MDLLRDIRFAGRLLVKNRWFTVMAVVVLALGIGANNAVFTIVNGVLLRNLPLPEPEEIMFIGTRDTQGRNQGVSLRDFEDWRAATRTFAGMSFLFNGAFNVGNEGLTPGPGSRRLRVPEPLQDARRVARARAGLHARPKRHRARRSSS